MHSRERGHSSEVLLNKRWLTAWSPESPASIFSEGYDDFGPILSAWPSGDLFGEAHCSSSCNQLVGENRTKIC